MLERGGSRATVPFENLVMNAKNNIYILPGDRIYVYQEQQKFIAFGATGADTRSAARRDQFRRLADQPRRGRRKGRRIRDVHADAGAVFLYRRSRAKSPSFLAPT